MSGFVLLNLFYTACIAAWGVSVGWRVIHVQTRRCLLATAFFMLFWLAVRTVKWEFAADVNLRRYLWYLFYLPMLMIPLLCLYVAMSLGKSEEWRLSARLKLLLAVAGLLLLLVLTNDFHRKVFSFPADAVVWSDAEYSYEVGYGIVVVFEALCGLSTFGLMLRKTRALRNWRFLAVPVISLGLLLVYCVLYVLRLLVMFGPWNDLTLVFCLCVVAALEGCIQSGLIPSNTHYVELFGLSTIDGQIADERFVARLGSKHSVPLSEETVRSAVEAGVIHQEDVRLVCAPLKKGYVLWREDISEISEVIAELADKSEYLSARELALQEAVDTGMRERQLEEKNRLYNALMDETREELDSFEELLDAMDGTDDEAELKRLTKRLAIYCTHIKRRSNLIFLAEENQWIEAGELRYAIEEWLSSLRLGGVVCGSAFSMERPLALPELLCLYDAFQKVLLYVLDELDSLFVNCCERDEGPCVLVTLTCGANCADLRVPGVQLLEADGREWVLSVACSAGGGVP